MKKCPFCKKEIETNVTECPICKMVLIEKIPSNKTSSSHTYTPPKSSKENTFYTSPNKSSPKHNQYLRPYCGKCNLIYSMIKNIGLKNCTKCYQPLIFKSFNPYPKLTIGLLILIIAIITVVLSSSPIIWIGGFIWGVMMISSSFSTWEKVKKLDKF